MPLVGGLGADYSKYCPGFHLAESLSTANYIMAEPTPLYATLIEQDFDKIRAIIHDELTHIVDEQERRLDDLFKQPEKHDGRLDEEGRCHVRYVEEFGGHDVLLSNGGSHDLVFDPRTMLSLRDWLNQESDVLEKLAKEQ